MINTIYTIYNFISPSYMMHVKHRIQNINACKKKSFGDNTDAHTKHTHTLISKILSKSLRMAGDNVMAR